MRSDRREAHTYSPRNIVISPFEPNNIGAARYAQHTRRPDPFSIDLTLSNEFRYYKPGLEVVPVTEETDFRDLTVRVELAEGERYLLLPHTACLGITEETITLAPQLCGLLGTSRTVAPAAAHRV